ncbi:MAG: AAA family ATPase [Chlamydiales bacterium]|nr:AAA family ATPase [Chlamydiia bacterium]MCP5508573.1 AAA family ATPase [Chlamydiales bacterium]
MYRYALCILFALPMFLFAQNDQQIIIYLNGGSSVGKTTFARHLQERFDQPLLYVGIDWVIAMMPEKVNDFKADKEGELPGFYWERTADGALKTMRFGPFAQEMLELYRQMVNSLAAQGYSLVIDDISIGKEEVDKWRRTLQGYPVIYVGLTAPSSIIDQRERERGDRLIGVASKLALLVHEGVEYDLMLDTYQQSADENTEKIKKIIK